MNGLKDNIGVETHEHVESIPVERINSSEKKHDGTVKLTSENGVLLIPTPSQDPRDPLNIPLWQKLVILSLTCLYSTAGLTSVSGLGALLVYFIPTYVQEGKTFNDISALMTYPSLFMGIGNIISMPIVLAIGRRPVFLASCLLQVGALILCATNQNYEWHFGARCILGLAAGQSEALCPIMISEVFFLHERARYQQLFSTIQTMISGTLIILTSYMADAIGWRAWYYLFSGISGVVFLGAFFFIPETKYDRPLQAYKGTTTENGIPTSLATDGDLERSMKEEQVIMVNDVRILDTVNYLPRTRLSDMRIFVNKADWSEAVRNLKHMAQLFFFPNVCWAYTMNGVFLGINIAMGLTYGNVLSIGYHWADKYISVAQSGQIVVAFVCLPMLGYGSDWLVKFMARRKNGIHEPEHRILTLVTPLLLGIMFSAIYGQAAAHPENYHWLAIVFTMNGYYFTFIGANTSCITYLLDAYPTRAESSLVVLCAMRGVISFGLSYGTVHLYNQVGYDGAFGLFSGITAIFGVLGVVIYFTGKRIRQFVTPWTAIEVKDRPTMG